MSQETISPEIERIAWGKLQIAGQSTAFKDAKLFPGGAREWDWNETGTHHQPGIQPADVTELIEKGAQVIVLSKGYYERLQVCPETLQLLEKKNIEVHVEQTEKAVRLYNEFCKNRPAGALIHSTC